VPQVAVLVARPVAVQLLAVALQPVVQQQAVLPQRVVQQQQPVRRQLQPQPRLAWWQLVWRLWLSWLLQRRRKTKQQHPPLRPLPLPLLLPLQNNFPAVMKRPAGAFFLCKKPWLG